MDREYQHFNIDTNTYNNSVTKCSQNFERKIFMLANGKINVCLLIQKLVFTKNLQGIVYEQKFLKIFFAK